ncbi:alanine--tRNA ligase [Nitrososphaera sp.]|uniref:alanine--tRNA ligase n=1 Tax=Nitrososphaera sp. TaxID=1971748 RepID=UPI001856E7F3|nr:alanine--tRNA ligase [Nitrososphaera sp.]NWG36170.1 alanine--tRNA ligase [Nitrososphaera sp.]
MGKKELAEMFSKDPDRYYKVSLFDKLGFTRQKCGKCGKHFWSLVEKQACPDHEDYGFIGKPPTSKRLDYVGAWKETEKHFRENGHEIVRRYPVVSRWRDDLYFTIASIVDFQRVVGNQIVFELPANPLVVPQMCLRFNDIENVGLSGRHYTGFCMIGQTCNADAPGGYWKDRCIDLDYGMLTNGLGIKPEEITFVEDVWMGAGAFGYSLEYFVRGLELGNAVFTEFEGNEESYRVMPNKIIDMGAGLERFSWITMGTPTSYDCCFGPVVKKMLDATGTEAAPEILGRYFGAVSSKLENFEGDVKALKGMIARQMGMSYDELAGAVAPYEAVYTIADHVRTLLFAISDGALPSNVGGGYNLRVILRRALSMMERLGWTVRLEDIADMHIDYLKQMYPELEEHRQDARTILQLESTRYVGSRERMNATAESLKSKSGGLKVEDLLRLYESDGITPDFLVEQGVIAGVPSTFYTKLAELHASVSGGAQVAKPVAGLEGLPATRLLYYEDESIREFEAKVLRVAGKHVVLDQTAFYPRGGGQEPDTGEISGAKVVEVTKQGDLVLHRIEGKLADGQVVKGMVNARRRDLITKHHTATHVLNSASRNNLGSWVWQNSAFKEESYGRLDITHHSALTKEEAQRIEQTANEVIRKNLPVNINFFDRGEAEQKYTFRIYQGGVVPTSNVRIVNIEGWDIEACGGTHVRRTGEIGMVKIVKSERVQDGVVRLEFVAGEAAVKHMQNQDAQLGAIAQALGSSKEKVVESFAKAMEDSEDTKKKAKTMLRVVAPAMAKTAAENAKRLKHVKLYSTFDEELDDDYHIAVGEKAIEIDPELVYVALIAKGAGMRVIVFAGEKARAKVKAGAVAKQVSAKLGGSGGGNDRFGQGGGKSKEMVKDALLLAEETARAG